MPVYNAEKHICKCLDSILSQNITPIEIIAVNDCSTDKSLDILNNYKKIYPLLKIINHTTNKGAGAARNIAIKNARGKYITFIDSDDYIGDEYLVTLFNEAEKTRSDFVISNMLMVDNNNEHKYSRFFEVLNKYKNSGISLVDLPCDWRSTAPWMKLFRNDFITNNDLKFMEGIRLGAEDIPFSWIAYFNAKNISFCEDVYYYYNYIPDSLDRCVNDNILEIFDALDFTYTEYQRFDPLHLRKAQLDTLYISHAYYQFSKITNITSDSNIDLAAKYWILAQNNLTKIPIENIDDNSFLQEHEKSFYNDLVIHPAFNTIMQHKYFSGEI